MTVKIDILDGNDVPHPEDMAMLQALYSRSPKSVDDHLEKVKSVGSGRFVERFYIGYGHKSIGDCGTITIFIEGVTMLTAKAVQDWALYSGQESSTRYMDFSKADFYNPLGTGEGRRIQEKWREFYLGAQEPVRDHLRNRHPRQEGENEKSYERAVNARSFDILRSFLPAGAKTNLSWHTNLRQASDHLEWLLWHPDSFVREVAESLWSKLKKRYPNSFKDRDLTEDQVQYLTNVSKDRYFLHPDEFLGHKLEWRPKTRVVSSFGEGSIPKLDLEVLANRPRGIEVPRYFEEFGTIKSNFMLDFGSYRDLQRHRSGIIRMPLLTTGLGFNSWYLRELPETLCDRAEGLLADQSHEIDNLVRRGVLDEVSAQNYIAMGYKVPCRVVQGIPGLVYRLELRSSKMVHPTLREVVLEEIRQFRKLFPNIALHVDTDLDSWSVRRGEQTIEERK